MQIIFPETKIFTQENHPAFDSKAYLPEEPPPNIVPYQQLRLKDRLRWKFFRKLNEGRNVSNRGEKIDGRTIKRVLLFRYDAVGDYIVSTPVIRWLKAAIPDIEIDVVSSYRNDSIAKIDSFIHQTFPIHPKHGFRPSWVRMIREVRKYDYEVIFALAFTRMTKCAILARSVSEKAKIVTILNPNRRDIYGQLFDHQIEHFPWQEHWIKTMLRTAVETIEPVVEPDKSESMPYLPIDEQSWRKVEKILHEEKLAHKGLNENIFPGKNWSGESPQPTQGAPYCVVNISAFTKNRQWKTALCVVVCKEILASYPDLRIFVSGAPDDKKEIREIVRSVNDERCGHIPMKLTEFFAFLAGAKFLISPDTAPLHIAAVAGVPVVGLYAEYIKICEWYPYGGVPFALVLGTDPETINCIEPEKIIEATKILQNQINP